MLSSCLSTNVPPVVDGVLIQDHTAPGHCAGQTIFSCQISFFLSLRLLLVWQHHNIIKFNTSCRTRKRHHGIEVRLAIASIRKSTASCKRFQYFRALDISGIATMYKGLAAKKELVVVRTIPWLLLDA